MNMTTPPNPFEALWSLGYKKLCPIVPPDAKISPASSLFKRVGTRQDARGKVPGVKRRDGTWSSYDWAAYSADENDLRRWNAIGAGIGIKTGDQGDGTFLAAIDADAHDVADAALIWAEVESAFGPLPTREGRPPKKAYLIRVNGPTPYQHITFGPLETREEGRRPVPRDRLEILTTNKQLVAYGIHPGTKQPYRWTRKLCPYAELPLTTPESIAALLEKLRMLLPDAGRRFVEGHTPEVSPEALRGDPRIVKQAVEATPNTSTLFGTREAYRNFGYAIKASLPNNEPEALALFQSWCARWADGVNEPEVVASDWRRMKPPFRIGANYLYRVAHEASGGVFDGRVAQWFESIVEPPKYESIFAEETATVAAPVSLLGKTYTFRDPALIKPREFLYGYHYLREFLSVTVAPTKVGKSSLGIVEALAMASGKPLLGVQPEGCFRVRVWNGEDPQVEMERRVAAAMMHYGLTNEDIGDRLIVDSGRDMPIMIATQGRDGARIFRPVVENLISAIRAQKIDCLVLDPVVKIHSVNENDNMAIEAVSRELNLAAGECGIAIDGVHHSRKLNGGDASVDDSRGASSLASAARSVRVLARMTKKEGEKLGLVRRFRGLFRIADGSSNMAPQPAGEDEQWLQMASVDLRNGRVLEGGRAVRSDLVGVARRYDITALQLDDVEGGGMPGGAPLRAARERMALKELASGGWRRDPRAGDAWAGIPIARALDLDLEEPDDKATVKATLTSWIKSGKLTERTEVDQHRKLRTFVQSVSVGDIQDAPISLFD